MRRVLVVSPHPDDEAIGCGGTLRRHVVEGDAVHAVFLTSGEKGCHGRPAEESARVRESEAAVAARILGLAEIEFWRRPDGALRADRENVERLCRKLMAWKPDTIYVTHDRETHPDHRAAARLVARAVTAREAKVTVLQFEVWTPIDRIDHLVDVTACIEVKLAAIRAHKSQCDIMQFDDAFLGLARYRGEMHSWPEGDYAEVFRKMRV